MDSNRQVAQHREGRGMREPLGERGGTNGQSTLEYILVLAAILVAIIAAANSLMRPAVNQAMTDSTNAIKNATGRLQSGIQ